MYKYNGRDGSKPPLGMVALMGQRGQRSLRQRSGCASEKFCRTERRLNGWERLIGSSDEGRGRQWRFWVGKVQKRISGVAMSCFSPFLLPGLCHCTTEEIM